MGEADRLFGHGRPNAAWFGRPLRSSSGQPPDPERIGAAARSLGRPVAHVDPDGYECEIIGAAIRESGEIAYVESRAKDVGYHPHGANQRHIDITIRVHLVTPSGRHESADIESYNPFFGCDVRFFEWVGPTAVLIYREKHWTFACRFGDLWPPRFVKIEDAWVIKEDILGFIGYKEETVRRLSFPGLEGLEPLPVAEAERAGLVPVKPR
jgi:hypothetical protein